MDFYINVLWPGVSSQLWQFQTLFPQLNRQNLWFIVSPDRIIINPTFTAFHSNFMGCPGSDSFDYKFCLQHLLFIYLFFTTDVPAQIFFFSLSLPPPIFPSCTHFYSVDLLIMQECCLFPKCVVIQDILKCVLGACVRVSAAHHCDNSIEQKR